MARTVGESSRETTVGNAQRGCVVFVLVLLTSLTLAADDPLAVSSKTAGKLYSLVDVEFELQPVGKLLRTFANKHDLDIVIDPRVDTAAQAQGHFSTTPVEKVLSDASR